MLTLFILKVSSQVAFNSQRLKTKDKVGGAENVNLLRRERNGTPRQLTKQEDDYRSNSSGNIENQFSCSFRIYLTCLVCSKKVTYISSRIVCFNFRGCSR